MAVFPVFVGISSQNLSGSQRLSSVVSELSDLLALVPCLSFVAVWLLLVALSLLLVLLPLALSYPVVCCGPLCVVFLGSFAFLFRSFFWSQPAQKKRKSKKSWISQHRKLNESIVAARLK
jgi:hypothetical protein